MQSTLTSSTLWCPHIQAQMAATQKAIDLASELYSGKLLTSSQLASYLQVTRRTIEIWKAQRKIPFVAVTSRCHRFRIRDVERALERFAVLEVR
jgi:excisionase family DNA binding protein